MLLYPLGLMGLVRRNYRFEDISFQPYLLVAEVGALDFYWIPVSGLAGGMVSSSRTIT